MRNEYSSSQHRRRRGKHPAFAQDALRARRRHRAQDRREVRRTAAACGHHPVSRYQRVLTGSGARGRAAPDRRGHDARSRVAARPDACGAGAGREPRRDRAADRRSIPSSSRSAPAAKARAPAPCFRWPTSCAGSTSWCCRSSSGRRSSGTRSTSAATIMRLHVAAQFDSARIRLIEILNDRAYSDRDPQPQSVVWERMNLPIARGLRGLIYVLWDLVAGRSVGFVDPARRTWPHAHRLRRNRSASWRGSEPTPRFARPWIAAGRTRTAPSANRPALARLHPGRLVESGRREDQERHCGAGARRRPAAARTTRSTPARSTRQGRGVSRRCSPNTPAFTSRLRSNKARA